MPENGREKTSRIPKMSQFLIGGKNGHFAKAIAKQNGHKWSQMVSTGTDPQNTKNIQGRMENQEIRNHTPVCRDLHTLVDT